MKPILVLVFTLSLLLLCACSSLSNKVPDVKVEQPNQESFIEAVKQPIYSVNLIREEIPEYLQGITQSYQAPNDCYEYQQELSLLDKALGEDPIDNENDLDNVITLHLGKMIAKGVESNIPFNSLIKSLSGAKKHEREMLSARLRGTARRSYLKGWAEAKQCADNSKDTELNDQLNPAQDSSTIPE